MLLTELAKQKIKWLPINISDNGIVLSSRVRVARNLNDVPFPSRINKQTQLVILDKIISVLQKIEDLSNSQIYKLNNLDKIDRRLLMERHLISHEHATNTSGEPGLAFTKNEEMSIMINEEDHLRLQVITQGLSLKTAWEILTKIDDKLSEYLDFAFHNKFGFLTACPTNAGTGLRVSCLVHLPGLVITDEIERLINGLSRIGFSVRGFYGEGTKPAGNIFQISNATTLGKTEESMISDLEKIINTVIKYEKEALKKLSRNKLRQKVEDKVYRSYGILKYARSIDSDEMLSHISKLRLSVWLRMNLPVKQDSIDQLIFVLQPAHLQELAGKELTAQQRDEIRAEFIRKTLIS